MDKFGFFNLLNSYFSLNTQNSQKNDRQNTPPADILGNLFSNLSNQNQPDLSSLPKANATSPTEKSTPQAPLQQNMLFTMANHDDFVKRVKQKNKT